METKDKQKLRESALKEVEKMFGQGSVMTLGEQPKVDVDPISTGSMLIDDCLGIGGIPKGRITEIYGVESSGKSTLCLQLCRECQKQGGSVAYIDSEHSMNPEYAKHIGVDVEGLVFAQPNSGEEALEIAEVLTKSGGFDLIIIDSVAALTPQAELDGEMGDQNIGLLSRLMSKAMRKLAAPANKNNCAIVFINQIREKIGVMYGCLNGHTLVNFVDGRSIPIKEVVEKQISGDVWAYDEKNHKFVPSSIIDWHINGEVQTQKDYIHFETESSLTKANRYGFTVTPDHKILTKDGWKEAKNVSLNEEILSKNTYVINNTLADFMWGTFIGDCCIQKRTDTSAFLKIQDNNNREYMEWKAKKIGEFIPLKKKLHKKNFYKYVSTCSKELAEIKDELRQRDPESMLRNHYSDLGLAVWYMDDGCLKEERKAIISIKRFKYQKKKLDTIASLLEEKTGIHVHVNYKDGSLFFSKENMEKLLKRIYTYVPSCMQYKLTKDLQGQYKEFKLTSEKEEKEAYVKVLTKRNASKRQMRNRKKYDISIKDYHNYMVGGKECGIIVHNSPETTPGGRALKFYSSVRIEMRKGEPIKKGSEVLGNKAKVKIVKNKVAVPFKSCEVDLIYGEGFDSENEVVEVAVNKDLIHKAGSWFSYNGEKIGQGIDSVKAFLKENPDIKEEIVAKLKKEPKIDPLTGEVLED